MRGTRRQRDQLSRDDYSGYYEDEVELANRKKRQRKDDSDGKFQLPMTVVHLMILGSIGLLLLGLVWAVAGGPVLEKTLQAVVAPLGLIWIGLFTVTYFCLLHKQGFAALVSFACWILLTLGGNAIFSGMLVNSLQAPYEGFNVDALQKLDLVAVLGGGQLTMPNGGAQISDSGDRLLQAYLLFKQGKVERIICTGTSGLPLAEGELTQADAGEQILIALGVPKEKIFKIGGRNTMQELQALDKWVTGNNAGALRKGLITSAWHLPRALRLADTVGLKLEPIPADFSNNAIKPSPDLLIPASAHLHQVTQCLKEYLAGIVGR